MESYSAIKMDEMLIHATLWMSLENIMLSEQTDMQEVITRKCPNRLSVERQNVDQWLLRAGRLGEEWRRDCLWIWGFFWG